MTIIDVKGLTKDFGEGKGIFDLDFEIKQGEVIGITGANGSGKTTTIRHLMGFIKPDQGQAIINGLDAWKDSSELKKVVGYIPGEIAFPDYPTGNEFIKAQLELMGSKNYDIANYVAHKLKLDTSANLKRMSKGMKQKTAIVAAFMSDSPILFFDEPTTGLDPLMRRAFLDLILEEKKKGKTIIMATHIYEEIEQVCDRYILLDKGHVVDIASLDEIKHHEQKSFKIGFASKEGFEWAVKTCPFVKTNRPQYNQIIVEMYDQEINKIFDYVHRFKVKYISEIKYDLRKHIESKLGGKIS